MEGLNNRAGFIQKNSPDGALNHAVQGKDFLQSEEWRKFQEAIGRKVFCISDDKDVKSQSDHVPSFHASIVEHKLPVVGKYFYVPRGPVIPAKAGIQKNFLDSGSPASPSQGGEAGMTSLLDLARKENAGWIRFDANSQEILGMIKNAVGADLVSAQKGQTQGLSLQNYKIVKAPHNMQPREILVMDITKSEEELLAEMKPKTRYNIKLSQKRLVSVKVISNFQFPISPAAAGPRQGGGNKIPNPNDQNSKFYIDKFIELVKITARRDKITSHPENYYRKMFEVIPSDILKLYVAEYQGKVIAANIVIFYRSTATYLHGASDYNYRDAMAPYLLQWRAILDAKKAGCTKYDMGGVKISNFQFLPPSRDPAKAVTISDKIPNFASDSWQGITRFKTGFAPNTKPIIFPGSYDIVLKSFQYNLYRILQKVKSII